MKQNAVQYLAPALVIVALTILTILHFVDVSLVVGIFLGILGVGVHISGVNVGVPLTPIAPPEAPVASSPGGPG